MALYLVGLGLGDERDVTVRGREVVERCEAVWLESYTSILGVDRAKLEAFYARPIGVASLARRRETVESEAEATLLGPCLRGADVALLVVGDPLCATTHADLFLRARRAGIRVEVVQNASVAGAVATCGLQLYRFGQTVSIPFFEGDWRPTSFYDKIAHNASGDGHTLCLLDIKTREPDYAALAKRAGRLAYLPPRFMTVSQAIDHLFEAEATHGRGVCARDTLAVGLARLGREDQTIVAGTLEELQNVDFGGPLHSLVVCAPTLHDLEREFLDAFRVVAGEQQHAESKTTQPPRAAEKNDDDDADDAATKVVLPLSSGSSLDGVNASAPRRD